MGNSKDKLLQTLLRLPTLPQRVAVAFSGGVDSTALLHAVCQEQQGDVLAIHVNHNIQANAGAWAAHCERLAKQCGADFVCHEIVGLTGDKRDMLHNLEARARAARWAGLLQHAQAFGAQALLLAHHAQDQAETVLLNLLRGSGLAGMGMRPAYFRDDAPNLQILRPFLIANEKSVTKEDLIAYCTAHELPWLEDPSNAYEKIRRNAVRHRLWPVVMATDARALTSLTRFSAVAQEEHAALHDLATAALQPYFVQTANASLHQCLNWRGLSHALPLSTHKAILRTWLTMLGCTMPSEAGLSSLMAQISGTEGYGFKASHAGWDFSQIHDGAAKVGARRLIFAREM